MPAVAELPPAAIEPPTVTTGAADPPRYKLRFESPEAMRAATAMESPVLDVKLRDRKRRVLAVSPTLAFGKHSFASDDFTAALTRMEREYRAVVEPDRRYAPEVLQFSPDVGSASLDDVLDAIRVRGVWSRTRGEDATIAIVDSGVNGRRPEFPKWKQVGGYCAENKKPWEDDSGHGTMCACIASATRSEGGAFDGVAPQAQLYSCRTNFYSSDLVMVYDHLIDQAAQGRRLVVSNSWGIPAGTAPEDDSDLNQAIEDGVTAGLTIVFSAGNYHIEAGGNSSDHTPTSIWLQKCRSDVLTVAASRLHPEDIWFYSSRGPGQWFGRSNCNSKPDVASPSPAAGSILFGDAVKTLVNGWGTSGSCPQAAGLCALLLCLKPALSRPDLFDIIRTTARRLPIHPYCQGAGVIDCAAAAARV